MPDPTTSWLIATLLDGEATAWARIASDGRARGVPEPLIALATSAAAPEGLVQPAEHSASLRRLAIAAPNAEASLAIASASLLILTAGGFDDGGWPGLVPRWLVPAVDPVCRGLGLLALAIHSREQLHADDYASMVEEALRLLPAESPLRISHLHQFALYLGLRGMLHRLDDLLDLPRPGDAEPEVEPGLLAECFYDAVCCGRSAQASFLAQRIDATPEVAWQLGLVHMHRLYIPLFAAVSAHQEVPADAEAPSAPIVRALLQDDHAFLDTYDVGLVRGEISPLMGYDGLRVALARRDIEAARRLIDERSSGPERHWLDDLFIARLMLLMDRPREAGAAFARVDAAAKRYGAMERLEFELRLAAEMTRHDCCALGIAAGSLQGRGGTAAAPKQVASPDTALLAGCSGDAADLRQAFESAVAESARCVLVTGPCDGSTRSISALLATRLGAGPGRRVSAAGCRLAGWSDRLVEQARSTGDSTGGCLVLDDIELLDAAAQAEVLGLIEGGPPCRLIATASQEIEALVDGGSWRRDLFWTFAACRIRVPELSRRNGDLGDIATSLVRMHGSSARLEIQAVRTLIEEHLPGGFAQLRLLCRELARMRPSGSIDGRAVRQAAAAIGTGAKAAIA